LPPIQNGLDNPRREQGQPQEAADVRVVDRFGPGDFGDAGVGAVLDKPLPPECAGERLDESAVDAGAARQGNDAVGADDELAPSPPVQLERYMDRENTLIG
jgi:hypothetical protein